MVITYHGLECFKVQFGDTVVVFNPPSKESKKQSVRFSGDIILSSLNHPDFNGFDTIPPKNSEQFIVKGPGEYEIKGVFIKGFMSESMYSGKKMINTVYRIKLENMSLCFLGGLSKSDLSREIISALDGIDILFVPIGGGGVLDPSEGFKLATQLEPSIIIPMHYDGDKDPLLKTFLKEGGSLSIKPQDKLTAKQKEVSLKQGEVVVLSSS